MSTFKPSSFTFTYLKYVYSVCISIPIFTQAGFISGGFGNLQRAEQDCCHSGDLGPQRCRGPGAPAMGLAGSVRAQQRAPSEFCKFLRLYRRLTPKCKAHPESASEPAFRPGTPLRTPRSMSQTLIAPVRIAFISSLSLLYNIIIHQELCIPESASAASTT